MSTSTKRAPVLSRAAVIRAKNDLIAARLDAQCEMAGFPKPVREYPFHDTRKWRFDFAWPSLRIALEQEGGIWTRGRHTRGAGYVADLEKYNSAVLLGWRVLRLPPDQIATAATVTMLQRLAGSAR